MCTLTMNPIQNLCDTENDRRDSDVRPKVRNDLMFQKTRLSMDDALLQIKGWFLNYLLVLLSAIVLYVATIEVCAVVYVFPVSQCDLNLTPSQKGILGGAAPFGIICSAYLWGYLADTKGRRAVIVPTLFGAFFSSVCASFVQNFYVFALLRFFNGFFISGSSATIYAYLSEFHSNKRRSGAIMTSAAIFCSLCLLEPLLAWGVINQDWQFHIPLIDLTYKPWRLFLVACSLPELIVAIILLFLPESPKFMLAQGNKSEAYEILQKYNRMNNGQNSPIEPFELYEEQESIENRQRVLDCKNSRFPLLKSIWIQTAPLLKPPYLSSTLLICAIQFISYVTAHGFFMFLGQILNQMASNLGNFVDDRMQMCDAINMKPTNISSIEMDLDAIDGKVCVDEKLKLETLKQGFAAEAIFAVGQIVIALIINRIGKFPIIFSIYIVCGLGGVVAMLTDIPIVQVYAYTALVSCGLAVNVVNAVAIELFPTSMRAMAMCISLMFGRLGGVFGANAAALLLDNHCEFVFYSSGLSIMATAVLAFFIPNIHKKVSKDRAQNDPRISILSFRAAVN